MIHSTAIIEQGAQLGVNIQIGPYTTVGRHVRIGDNCEIGPRCSITGHATLGACIRVHTGAVIGDEPQDYHYQGAETYTTIGDHCTIREYVTIHRGSQEGTTTVVGNNAMLMGFVHVAHNCVLGNNVTIGNMSLLAGHVEIGDRAFLSGGVMVHQFSRIGELAMAGGGVLLTQDIPPYCMVARKHVNGPNVVGLRRAGWSVEQRNAIRQAIKLYFFSGLGNDAALDAIREQVAQTPEVERFVSFVAASTRGIVRGVSRRESDEPGGDDTPDT